MKEDVIPKQTRIGSIKLIIPNNSEGTAVSRDLVPKITIIDDDVGMLELFKVCLLEIKQYPEKNIAFAQNGCEALKIISHRNKENFPHIIITDFKMPRMDGITFCNQLFSQYNDLGNYFVVVFYSGCAEGILEHQTKELFRNIKGLIRYKPYNIFALIDEALTLLHSE